MARRTLKVAEHTGVSDPNEELIQVAKHTAEHFANLLQAETNVVNKIREDILACNDQIVRLSNQVTRDEHRVRLGEQRLAVLEFALVKAKSLGELTKKFGQQS